MRKEILKLRGYSSNEIQSKPSVNEASENIDDSIILNNPLLKKDKIEVREYQVKIAESSIGKNTLVILPTALGKTIIAVYVSAYYLHNQPNSRILVMAPTKPLLNQHKERFTQLLNIDARQLRVLTGETSPEERRLWWNSRNVKILFATPEVVRNDLENGLSLEDFSLLIFDEAHRARKGYAYTNIAQHYVSYYKNTCILALTASPGGSIDRVREIVKNLFIENIVYRSEYDEDVSPYIHKVRLEYRVVEPPKSYERYAKLIKEILEDYLRELREADLIKKEYKQVSRKDLLEIGETLREKIKTEKNKYVRGLSWNLLLTQNTALILLHALELLLSQGAYTLKRFLMNLITSEKKSHRRLMKDPRFQVLMNMLKVELEEHPKIQVLIEELDRQFNLEPRSRVIIFTQYRDTAEHLVNILKARNFKAEIFVGQRKDKNSVYMSQRDQLQIIKRFREGSIHVLVSTSIGEEGLDIPQCSLVIFYEPIPSEIRFIQRRGRTGRVRTGRCIILITKRTLDEVYLESAYKKVKKVKDIIEKINQEIKQKNLLGYTNPTNISISEASHGVTDKNSILKNSLTCDSSRKALKEMETENYTHKLKEEKETPTLNLPRYIEQSKEATSTIVKSKISITKLSKIIYKRILKSGEEGFPRRFLIEELSCDGYDISEINRALKKLLKSQRLYEEDGRLYPIARRKLERSRRLGEGLRKFKVFVEEIYPGKILVLVNERWRAVIPVEMNDELISLKKNSEYVVIGKLLRIEGRLHLRLHGVVREL
jgi:Fanconi anemia group M protein